MTTVKILKFLFDENKTGITKPCTQLHPAPSTSTQLISVSTHLSATPSIIFELKYCTQLANFPKFRPKNQKLSILTENWHKWYIGGFDSESRHKFLKFRPQNLFLGKFGPKKSKVFVLSESWYTWYLKDADPYSNINFLNFKS